jgi:hypothetical protein
VRARLVGHDVDRGPAAHELGHDLGGVAEQADRERAALALRRLEPCQRVVERAGPLVEVALADAALDPLEVDLDAQRAALVHGHRERLGPAHPAESRRHHEPPAQRPAEALPRDRRERLVGALEDALGPDVDPGPGRHLPVHHQPRGVELAEVLPRRPAPDQVGVRDQHPRRIRVGLEHRDGLARLDEQRLVASQADQLAPDRLEARMVAGGLADAAVDHELLGLLGDVGVQVVLEHPQGGLLLPPAAPQGLVHARASGVCG